MDLSFFPVKLTDVPELRQGYVSRLSSPIDSFLEDHILSAQSYLIHGDESPLGICAVYEQELLTLFYLVDRHGV